MEETQIPSHVAQRTLREKKKISPLNEFKFRGMASLVKQTPNEKTCSRGKRQLLILILSEIRRVSFYNMLWKLNNERKKRRE